jgi:putative Mn2+ efflux pump MntP
MNDIMEQLSFIFANILLGVALAMDSFSISVANGLNEPSMKWYRITNISCVFAIFHGSMPLIGWTLVVIAEDSLDIFNLMAPWIALVLLVYIGGNMIKDGISDDRPEAITLGFVSLLIQGFSLSIDALSVGFVMFDYDLIEAIACSIMIGLVTWIFCITGLVAGKKLGSRLSKHATIFGGMILIIIGLEIFISGIFF